jgi:hypothetical protein
MIDSQVPWMRGVSAPSSVDDSFGGKAEALTPGEAAAMRRAQALIRAAPTWESII